MTHNLDTLSNQKAKMVLSNYQRNYNTQLQTLASQSKRTSSIAAFDHCRGTAVEILRTAKSSQCEREVSAVVNIVFTIHMCTLCMYIVFTCVHCIVNTMVGCGCALWRGEPLREGLSIRTHFFVQLFNAFRQYPCHPGFVDKERN